MLNSAKILTVSDGVALSSDEVRSGGAPTSQNLYLKCLIKLLVRRLDHIVVRENREAVTSKPMRSSASVGSERT